MSMLISGVSGCTRFDELTMGTSESRKCAQRGGSLVRGDIFYNRLKVP